jgi:hypothetical protein
LQQQQQQQQQCMLHTVRFSCRLPQHFGKIDVGAGAVPQCSNTTMKLHAGGPLMGNGDLSAVLTTDKTGSVLTWWITKTDAWSTSDIFGLGTVSVSVPGLNATATKTFAWQDLGAATTFGTFSSATNEKDFGSDGTSTFHSPTNDTAFSSDGVKVTMESFVAASTNILVTTLNITSSAATTIDVSHAVYAG